MNLRHSTLLAYADHWFRVSKVVVRMAISTLACWHIALRLTLFGTLTSCQVQDDLVPLSDAITIQTSGEGSMSSSLSADLDVMFVRIDQKGGRFPEGYLGTGAVLLPATVSKDDNRVTFEPTQYYSPDGSSIRLVGWYPAGGVWNAAQRTVSFPVLDGTTDIMATAATDGSLTGKFSDIPFIHALTRVQLFAYVGNEELLDYWGKLTSVELVDKMQTCTLTLPATGDPAGTEPVASFGEPDGNLFFQKMDGSGPMADVVITSDEPDPDTDTPVGYAMFAPHTDEDEVLTLKVTTEFGDVQLLDVPYADMNLEAGYAYNLIISFEATSVKVTATLADWTEGEFVEGELEMVVPTANCFIIKPNGSANILLSNAVLYGGASRNAKFTAEILWDDTSGGAIFSVDEPVDTGATATMTITASANPGNALVAVKDTDGIIRWSYHIWVTDYDPNTDGASWINTYNTNNNGKHFVFMDRNLGAMFAGMGNLANYDENTNPTAGYDTGLFYQWGRKDPFPATLNRREIQLGGGTFTIEVTSSINGTVANTIKNPSVFYHGLYGLSYDWYWGDGTGEATGRNNTLWGHNDLKSPYDPCPSGWRVPMNYDSNTGYASIATSPWAGMVSNDEHIDGQTFVNGYTWTNTNFSTTSYAATGYRPASVPGLRDVGIFGYYWTASASSNDPLRAEYLLLASTGITESASFDRASGFVVRCVKDN